MRPDHDYGRKKCGVCAIFCGKRQRRRPPEAVFTQISSKRAVVLYHLRPYMRMEAVIR